VVEVGTPHGPARVHLHPVREPRAALVLGHGAGGGVGAKDRAPAPAAQLDSAWIAVVEHLLAGELSGLPLVTGGRSLGARVACRTAGATGAAAVLCLAFPLLPPQRAGGKPSQSRLPELEAVNAPVLVVQGESDRFGMPPAGTNRTVARVPGDHSLRTDVGAVEVAVWAWLPGVVAVPA